MQRDHLDSRLLFQRKAILRDPKRDLDSKTPKPALALMRNSSLSLTWDSTAVAEREASIPGLDRCCDTQVEL